MTDQIQKPKNPPAFPHSVCVPEGHFASWSGGQTLWDWYASHSPIQVSDLWRPEKTAESVANYADAMLAERAKRGIE